MNEDIFNYHRPEKGNMSEYVQIGESAFCFTIDRFVQFLNDFFKEGELNQKFFTDWIILQILEGKEENGDGIIEVSNADIHEYCTGRNPLGKYKHMK